MLCVRATADQQDQRKSRRECATSAAIPGSVSPLIRRQVAGVLSLSPLTSWYTQVCRACTKSVSAASRCGDFALLSRCVCSCAPPQQRAVQYTLCRTFYLYNLSLQHSSQVPRYLLLASFVTLHLQAVVRLKLHCDFNAMLHSSTLPLLLCSLTSCSCLVAKLSQPSLLICCTAPSAEDVN